MNGHWQTVWNLAGMRHGTWRGLDWITKHQFEVLQQFMQDEARDAMAESVGDFKVVRLDLGELEIGILTGD